MYLLFAGDDYYPKGGANDLKGSYVSLDDAIDAHNPNEFDYDGGWANILNIETMKIEARFGGSWIINPEQ